MAVLTLLFAATFKLLPDVIVRWRDVWVGAIATAARFTIGKFLIGWYLAPGYRQRLWCGGLVRPGVGLDLLLRPDILIGAELTQSYVRHICAGGAYETIAIYCRPRTIPDTCKTLDTLRGRKIMRLVGAIRSGQADQLLPAGLLGTGLRPTRAMPGGNAGAMIGQRTVARMSGTNTLDENWPPRCIVAGTLVVCAVAGVFAPVLLARHVLFFLFIAIVLSTAVKPLVDF